MKRGKRIQHIVWALLALADEPEAAVATATQFVDGQEVTQAEFRSLLRAAGAFAKNEDGYFIRYQRADGVAQAVTIPEADYRLALPVPVEPRMRIAYGVFQGLLLKHLYQIHGAIPTVVSNGLALLRSERQLPDAAHIWHEFRNSNIAQDALNDGIEAALGAMGRTIGTLPLTDTLADSAVLPVLSEAIPRHLRTFQPQSGLCISFFEMHEVNGWAARGQQFLQEAYTACLAGSLGIGEASEIIAARLIEARRTSTGFLRARRIRDAWKEEKQQRGLPKPEERDTKERLRHLDVVLSGLDSRQCDASDLHRFVSSYCKSSEIFRSEVQRVVFQVQAALVGTSQASDSTPKAQPAKRRTTHKQDISDLVEAVETDFSRHAIVVITGQEARAKRERRAALLRSLQACLAIAIAKQLGYPRSIVIGGWNAETLQQCLANNGLALRYLDKISGPGVETIARLTYKEEKKDKDILTIGIRSERGGVETEPVPFELVTVEDGVSASLVPVLSDNRCTVCGASHELLAGRKTFLPESKQRPYDSPSYEKEGEICSNCAFIAYLSSVYPRDDMSIVEFPTGNYLETFALYESLQGVSGLVALKAINRVATMSVFPNRYMLLSLRTGQGKIDTKTQVYLQLKEHPHLMRSAHDRPMRVQVKGPMAHVWTEIHSHVAIGLSFFRGLPFHTSTDGIAKGAAYEIVRALSEGKPYTALYQALRFQQTRRDRVYERTVLRKGVRDYDQAFVLAYAPILARALGGEQMKPEVYQDVVEFSNYLFDLLHRLVQREVDTAGTAVSGVARKYTDLMEEEFAQGAAGKFLYKVAQEVDQAERRSSDDAWMKTYTSRKLYGGQPDTRGKSGVEVAQAWDDFRAQHPRTKLEADLAAYHEKYGDSRSGWQEFIREAQIRTLSLLLLNVHNKRQS
jgi:hypothetical protein